MTRIARTAQVRVPHAQAIHLVEAFFLERTQLKVRGLGSSVTAVDVRYDLLYDWTRVLPRREGLAFAWQPPWRGFPSFGATLTVQTVVEDTRLVLEGSYEPPGGAAGRLFDRVVGKKLAERTMDALLRDLVRHVEAGSAKDAAT